MPFPAAIEAWVGKQYVHIGNLDADTAFFTEETYFLLRGKKTVAEAELVGHVAARVEEEEQEAAEARRQAEEAERRRLAAARRRVLRAPESPPRADLLPAVAADDGRRPRPSMSRMRGA